MSSEHPKRNRNATLCVDERERRPKRNRYATLNAEERERYIQHTKDVRKRKRASVNNLIAEDENNYGANDASGNRKRIRWLLRAQLVQSESEGEVLCDPMCSEPHGLSLKPPCHYCGAKKFDYEPPTFCCQGGEVRLASVEIPNELHMLFTSQTKEAEEFRKNIRAYNSIFSFTSFGVNLDKDLASGRHGIYTFRAQGQIYHHLPALLPTATGPCYFQLYFYDTHNEVQNRMDKVHGADLNEKIVKKLLEVLEGNPYAQFLRRLRDRPLSDDFRVCIKKDVKLDQRVYNLPSADQVAAIWIEGNDPHAQLELEIVVHAHSGHRHKVKHYYGCYDPLQYPLLFPNGEIGWHQNIQKRNSKDDDNNMDMGIESNTSHFTSTEDIFQREQQDVGEENSAKVSCRQYYCYKLQIREGELTFLLLAGRLLQQFIVDMYIKLETTRLDYFRRKQSNIRAELYQGIVDAVTAGETRGSQVGQRIVLPVSFVGGPRDMRRRYLDAMALVRRFGKPDLFITMTCNPEWKEIRDELKEGQSSQDRPDLVSRVFRAKLQDLKDQLFKKEVFGKVAANVHVIEFQKRGLPHAHMLIILKSEYKITSPDQYDKFVSAELPDRQKYPRLHQLVTKHMMHGPCGEKKRDSPCMVNGECKNHYPRPFCAKTGCGKDGYPIYRRRDNSEKVMVRNQELDNQWVVPYNPYLISRYNCHINVEICSGLKAVKYLYKYIYKGHDRVAVHVAHDDGEKTVDEIQQFQDARWVSAQEAMWRIYEFNLNEMHPPVINLQLHLPNKQSVTYGNRQNLEDVVNSDHISKTMLTEFFSMCSKSAKAKEFLYSEFPEDYVWDKKRKLWYERKRKEVIGRVNGANPAEGERYYLRLLLNHVRGPESFEDLLTVDGITYSTFKESAQKRGLLESDQSISECLNEAAIFQMPHALRRLFATILVYCAPADVRKLWDDHFDAMSEDFRSDDNSDALKISSTLKSLKFYLESMGKKIDSYDLPKVLDNPSDSLEIFPREVRDEICIEIQPEDLVSESNLNTEQQAAFIEILNQVNSGKGGVFFIDGPGGTGKTYLYRSLLAAIRSKKMIALATATSGVAAAIMPGGRTAHSRFKIPISANESSMCNIPKQGGTAELLRMARLIIWDEAPMAKRSAIETLDRTLKDILDNENDFGGKVVVFGGDFRQVLPVVPRATREQTVNASLVKSYLWPRLRKLTLTKNMRARTDPKFSELLLQIGNGDQPTNDDGMIVIPKEMVIEYDDDEMSEQCLIDSVFPSLHQNFKSSEYMTNRAILATKNEYVDKLNEKMINMFPGEAKTFISFDEAVDDTCNYYQEEFLNSLTPNGLPPHKLILKVNCPIMLLRNLDPSNGLCNGTRMVCRNFVDNVIHAEITVGVHAGKHVFLPRIPLSPAENEGYPFQFKRKQYPIRLCFAMTINKAQGQTISNVGIYLPQPVFSHGQLYVALSRGISMSTTKVLIKSDVTTKQKETCTRNVVYKEVLNSGNNT